MPGAQIHVADFPRQNLGCILVGAAACLNQILTSKAAMETINAITDADGGIISVTITGCEITNNCEWSGSIKKIRL